MEACHDAPGSKRTGPDLSIVLRRREGEEDDKRLGSLLLPRSSEWRWSKKPLCVLLKTFETPLNDNLPPWSTTTTYTHHLHIVRSNLAIQKE